MFRSAFYSLIVLAAVWAVGWTTWTAAHADEDGHTSAVPLVQVSLSKTMCQTSEERAVVAKATEQLYFKTARKMGWQDEDHVIEVGPGLVMCKAVAYGKRKKD